ncbi:MAG: hypothetical protein KatS3mg012_0596 [Gaiellaceae bacterium]|nr:MAG: hypothetical protein KatS3mg012_0596 [Gaiellaceae bacterium]
MLVFFEDDEPEPDLDELTLYEAAEALQNGLLAHATGGSITPYDYGKLRRRLMNDSRSKELVPTFVRTCRDPAQFWGYIKARWAHYHERRTEIWDAFAPLLEALEAGETPSDAATTETLSTLDADHVHAAWDKALSRRASDPEGAITAARTLLETVCKLILDDLQVTYSDDDLPKLYGKVASALNIAPSEHTEEAFKQILGGCWSVVNGLATLRNRISDAHGQGSKPVRPAPRHAELAVNLAGAMASFLVATWEARKAKVETETASPLTL